MFTESDGEAWKEPELTAQFPRPLLSPDDDTLPEGTSEHNPLTIWVKKEMLLETIKDSLESINSYRTSMDRNLDGVEHTDSLIIQRRQFREWLQNYPLSHVYLSIVPRQYLREDDDDDDVAG